MRLTEMITESVTFSVSKIDDVNGERVHSDPFSTTAEGECELCDGDGKDFNDETQPCRRCNGTGKSMRRTPAVPELNISNDRAALFLKALGFGPSDDGLVGEWMPDDLPIIRRRLIVMKNKGVDNFVQEPYTQKGEMQRYKDDNGVTSIGRGGSMMHGGNTQEQLDRYIDSLLKIVEFAQKNGAAVTWY